MLEIGSRIPISSLTENVDYLSHLVGAVLSLKQDGVVEHLAHDASRGPNIHFESVVLAAKDQLIRNLRGKEMDS